MQQAHYRVYLCGGPHCSGQRGRILPALEQALAAAGVADQVQVLIGGCLSRCERGPNMIIHPGGTVYAGLDAAAVRVIVDQHLAQHQIASDYLDIPAHR